MNAPELWLLSLQAFAAVITVLGVLAAAVQLLTLVFRAAPATTAPASAATPTARPARQGLAGATDPYVHAAIHAAAQQLVPGSVVTQIAEVEEEAPR